MNDLRNGGLLRMIDQGGYGTSAGAKKNPWIKFLKQRAKTHHNGDFSQALQHPSSPAAYRSSRGNRVPPRSRPVPPRENKRQQRAPAYVAPHILNPRRNRLEYQRENEPLAPELTELEEAVLVGATRAGDLTQDQIDLLYATPIPRVRDVLFNLFDAGSLSNGELNRAKSLLDEMERKNDYEAQAEELPQVAPNAAVARGTKRKALDALELEGGPKRVQLTIEAPRPDEGEQNLKEDLKSAPPYLAPFTAPTPSTNSKKRKANDLPIDVTFEHEDKPVVLRKEYKTLPATKGQSKRNKARPATVVEFFKALPAEYRKIINTAVTKAKLGPKSLEKFYKEWDGVLKTLSYPDPASLSYEDVTALLFAINDRLRAKSIVLNGSGFFDSLWNGIKKGAQIVAAPLNLISNIPGVSSFARPISAVVSGIAGSGRWGAVWTAGRKRAKAKGGRKFRADTQNWLEHASEEDLRESADYVDPDYQAIRFDVPTGTPLEEWERDARAYRPKKRPKPTAEQKERNKQKRRLADERRWRKNGEIVYEPPWPYPLNRNSAMAWDLESNAVNRPVELFDNTVENVDDEPELSAAEKRQAKRFDKRLDELDEKHNADRNFEAFLNTIWDTKQTPLSTLQNVLLPQFQQAGDRDRAGAVLEEIKRRKKSRVRFAV